MRIGPSSTRSPSVQEERYIHFFNDTVERTAGTFVQTLSIALLAEAGPGGLTRDPHWKGPLSISLAASIVALITSAALAGLPREGWMDFVRRPVLTFLQAFLGVFASKAFIQHHAHVSVSGALALALPIALTALLKSIAAYGNLDSRGASLLPERATGAKPLTAQAANV